MYDLEKLDKIETKNTKKQAKKKGFFAKLAYCWINVNSIIR